MVSCRKLVLHWRHTKWQQREGQGMMWPLSVSQQLHAAWATSRQAGLFEEDYTISGAFVVSEWLVGTVAWTVLTMRGSLLTQSVPQSIAMLSATPTTACKPVANSPTNHSKCRNETSRWCFTRIPACYLVSHWKSFVERRGDTHVGSRYIFRYCTCILFNWRIVFSFIIFFCALVLSYWFVFIMEVVDLFLLLLLLRFCFILFIYFHYGGSRSVCVVVGGGVFFVVVFLFCCCCFWGRLETNGVCDCFQFPRYLCSHSRFWELTLGV